MSRTITGTTSGLLLISLLMHHQFVNAEEIPLPPSVEKNQPVASNNNPSLADENAEGEDSRNIPEPEVRIIKKKDATIEEYLVNGRVRYVKITPTVGKPYYMVDTDGDGKLDRRENDLDNPPINRWILLEW